MDDDAREALNGARTAIIRKLNTTTAGDDYGWGIRHGLWVAMDIVDRLINRAEGNEYGQAIPEA